MAQRRDLGHTAECGVCAAGRDGDSEREAQLSRGCHAGMGRQQVSLLRDFGCIDASRLIAAAAVEMTGSRVA